MVKIRLKRLGKKKSPVYRIVVINSESKREGSAITELGFYNPKSKELKFKKDVALSWIQKGAQPSETVKFLIDSSDENGNLVLKTEPQEKRLSKKAKAKLEAENQAAAA